MLFGGRYVAKKEIFSTPNVAEMGGAPKAKRNQATSSATPYPYPARKVSRTVPPFRVNSVLKSLNVNPEPLLYTKTPMELHKARIRITENEIGHSLNEASKKFFGERFPLPIKNRSTVPAPRLRPVNKSTAVHFSESTEFQIGENEDANASKLRSFSIRQGTYPAVVLLKTDPIAPLRLRSPIPLPKYQRRDSIEPKRLEDLNVINGFTHINTDGKKEENTFAMARTKKTHRDTIRDPRTGATGHFHAEIEMGGFHENEIYFQTDDSSLLVIGLRPRRDGLNSRKVTEVLDFPEGVYPESLCISRTANGTLILEETF